MLDLARRRGDGGVALLPGVSQSGMHWLARDCGLGVSLTPTAGTLGPDSVTRPSAAWLAAYVESTASTPAAVDGPVGFLSDGEGTVGAELSPNNFASWLTGTGWSVSNGVLTAASAAANSFANCGLITAGTTYRVTLRCSSLSAGGFKILLEGGGVVIPDATGPGTYTGTLKAAQTGGVYVWSNVTLSAVFDQISIKPLTGRHATQNSGPNKPTMRRGITNLLTYNQDAANAAWVKVSATVTNNAGIAPDGSNTAIRLRTTAANGALQQSCAAANTPFTQITWVKSNNGSNQTYQFWNGSASIQGTATTAWQLVTSGASSFSTGSRFDFGSPTSGADLLIWSPGAAYGTLTAQQILAAGGIPLTTTIAASGSGGNYALEFGGSVTQLQASFAPTNAATVVLAVRVNSFAGTPVLVGQAAGGLQVYINSGGGVQAGIAGGTNFGSANGVITAGAVYVISVRIAVNGTSTIRVNGVLVATTTAITAAMNQTTISIGSNGSSNFTGGLFGPVLLYTSVLNDAETLVLERGAGSLAPITGVKF